MTRVIVVGSVNLDFSACVDRLPAPGETITGATLDRFQGGKGGNQALAARRLGADVRLIAAVGEDLQAEEALSLLKEAGVDLSGCVSDADAATGIALITVARDGENHIVVAPGANAKLAPDMFSLPEGDALICQLEVPAATIAAIAAGFDGFFCANLAPAKEVDVDVLQRADLVVVNDIEADWYGTALSACDRLVAVTHGASGAELRQGGRVIAEAAPPPVRSIDTTGAGDAFTAALTVALVEGQPPDRALHFACAAGAAATTKRGAQPSLPTRAGVEALLSR